MEKIVGLKVFNKNVNLSKGGIMDDRFRGKRIKIKALENIKTGDFCFMFTKDENMKDWFLTKSKVNDEDVDEVYDYTMMQADFAILEHDVVGIKVFPVLEVKGGNIGINEYSDVVCKSLTTTLTKLAEFNISTPSLPNGLIVYKYALMVSVQCRYQSTVSGYYLKIYVDGEDKFTIPITGTLTWFDRALDINVGTHTVQIWCYNLVGNCPDYGVKNIKAQCGIGTVSTSDVKVAEVETCGEGRGDLAVVGKSYGEDATITGTQKVDDGDAERVSASGNITKGGTSYNYSASLSGAMFNARSTYYGRTSTGNVPIFHNYSRTLVRRVVK